MPDAHALYLFAGPQPTWPFTVEQLRAYEQRDGHGAWVVVDDGGRVIGQFELTITGTSAWLSRVIIDPAQRRRGLARVLVGRAIEGARSRGATEIGLKVIAGNDAAIRSYVAAGFHDTGDAERLDVVAMRLQLR
ncbi:GNAT family N-acetyltransferase [Gryllotalpicola daejeonensis]|uniref:GNAT family N-acetyltransferase n=1 Tax=Gryllotalpicola daejeonensis TaxID=993087 RepID=UPI0031D4A568